MLLYPLLALLFLAVPVLAVAITEPLEQQGCAGLLLLRTAVGCVLISLPLVLFTVRVSGTGARPPYPD